MTRMHAWEVAHHTRHQDGELEVLASARAPLDLIYVEYLTLRKRSHGRQDPLQPVVTALGWPPQFDPAQEVIEGSEIIAKGKVLISTRWAHPTVQSMKEKRRYTLLLKTGTWRIDKQEVFRTFPTERWQARAL
jgi:NTF2 fold immunity protein